MADVIEDTMNTDAELMELFAKEVRDGAGNGNLPHMFQAIQGYLNLRDRVLQQGPYGSPKQQPPVLINVYNAPDEDAGKDTASGNEKD